MRIAGLLLPAGLQRWSRACLVGLAGALACAGALADPPLRAGRLSSASGSVSFSPAGESDWVQAPLNRPLATGDKLWTDNGARAEVQTGHAAMRMGPQTSLNLLNLDDRSTQLQLNQGTLNLRVRSLAPGESFEVDTPNLAYAIRKPGSYRVDADPAANATTVSVRSGQADVYGDGSAYTIEPGQAFRFTGTGLHDFQNVALAPDELDRWAAERDRRWDNAVAARYVPREMVGYEDLDDNGTWRPTPDYGMVWVPRAVPAGWVPYSDGHWAWIEPWGWTWVDDEPWGFAPFHYGRWAHLDGGVWGWVPGPAAARPVYAPALVAFVGGDGFQLSAGIGGVGWFPLAPHEVYRPTYTVSPTYLTVVNNSNTVVNNINVTNIVYANQRVPGAVVAVPSTAFVHAVPVSRTAVRLPVAKTAQLPVVHTLRLAPVHGSMLGVAAAPAPRPPQQALARTVVARTRPPAPALPLAVRQNGAGAAPTVLAARPGVTNSAPPVKVVAAAHPVVPPARPLEFAPPAAGRASAAVQPPSLPGVRKPASPPGPPRKLPEPPTMRQAAAPASAPRPAPKPPGHPPPVPRPPSAHPPPMHPQEPPPHRAAAPHPPEAPHAPGSHPAAKPEHKPEQKSEAAR